MNRIITASAQFGREFALAAPEVDYKAAFYACCVKDLPRRPDSRRKTRGQALGALFRS
jgi:hypothetical protein